MELKLRSLFLNHLSHNHIVIFRHAAIGDVMVTLPALHDIYDKHKNMSDVKFILVGTPSWIKMLDCDKYHWIEKVFISDKKGYISEVFINPKSKYFNLDLTQIKNDHTQINRLETHTHAEMLTQTQSESSLVDTSNTDSSTWIKQNFSGQLSQLLNSKSIFYNLRTDSLRLSAIAFLKNVKECYATTPYWAQFLVSHCDPWIGFESSVHERDRMLKIVHAKPNQWWPIWDESNLRKIESQKLFSENERLARLLPCPVKLNFESLKAQKQTKTILINPTASERFKAWPAERFFKLAQHLKTHFNELISIKIIGAPNESEWLKEVSQNSFEIIQPSSMINLFSEIAKSDYLIANTSSSQFIANSVKTPVFTLIGRAQARRWGPLGKNDNWIEADIKNAEVFSSEEKAYASLDLESVYKKIELHLKKLYFEK